ncbi:hypothetical protein ACFVS2_26685 [Brevibacillus sp. NPDC058079]|uniref:hypothetical protein n=1 Tax=Brevibacillus sp. NPDC058079 TaxID=3346330 RepID=UPI0036EC442A
MFLFLVDSANYLSNGRIYKFDSVTGKKVYRFDLKSNLCFWEIDKIMYMFL